MTMGTTELSHGRVNAHPMESLLAPAALPAHQPPVRVRNSHQFTAAGNLPLERRSLGRLQFPGRRSQGDGEDLAGVIGEVSPREMPGGIPAVVLSQHHLGCPLNGVLGHLRQLIHHASFLHAS